MNYKSENEVGDVLDWPTPGYNSLRTEELCIIFIHFEISVKINGLSIGSC